MSSGERAAPCSATQLCTTRSLLLVCVCTINVSVPLFNAERLTRDRQSEKRKPPQVACVVLALTTLLASCFRSAVLRIEQHNLEIYKRRIRGRTCISKVDGFIYSYVYSSEDR